MISKFTRLFKKTDQDEQRAFQAKVLSILRDVYPERQYRTSDDPLTIELDGRVLGLSNIQAKFHLGSQTEIELREIVIDHFQRLSTGLNIANRELISWADASSRVKPQLMSDQYLEKVPLVSFPFGGGIVLGFVIDSEETYSYVSRSDIARWNISDTEIQARAIENLSESSQGMELAIIPPPNAFVAVDSMDGFDAARIVVPRIREVFAENIGSPFYFGVPNRDFLICWANTCDDDFARQMRSQISQDFDERPYPLTRTVFEVLEDGAIKEAPVSRPDPNVFAAEYN